MRFHPLMSHIYAFREFSSGLHCVTRLLGFSAWCSGAKHNGACFCASALPQSRCWSCIGHYFISCQCRVSAQEGTILSEVSRLTLIARRSPSLICGHTAPRL